MEFLPIRYAGERVYAGFWRRFGAMWIDAFIVMAISFFFLWLEGFDKLIVMFIEQTKGRIMMRLKPSRKASN